MYFVAGFISDYINGGFKLAEACKLLGHQGPFDVYFSPVILYLSPASSISDTNGLLFCQYVSVCLSISSFGDLVTISNRFFSTH